MIDVAVIIVSWNVRNYLSDCLRSVAADLSTVYVGDSRGVLSLGSTNGEPDQYWTEVETAMTPGLIPVLP